MLFTGATLAALAWALWAAADPSRVNHDVAWHQTLGAGLFDGGVFGVDLIDVNPPWIFVAHAVSRGLATSTGIAPLIMWSWLCVAVQAASLLLARRPLAQLLGSGVAADVLLSGGIIGLVAGAGYDFGQRDALVVALLLPYGCALALAPKEDTQRTPLWRALAAVLAVSAVLLKLHYAALVLVGELWLLRRCGLRRWSSRWALRAGVGALVVAVVMLFAVGSAWLRAIGTLAAVYTGFSNTFVWLQPTTGWVLAALALALLDRVHAAVPSATNAPPNTNDDPQSGAWLLVRLLAIASAVALLIAWQQAKGYSYHLVPARMFAIASLAVGATSLLVAQGLTHRLFVAATLALVPWFALVATDRDSVPARMDEITLSRAMAKYAGKGGLFAIATSISPVFPAVLFTDARWVGREGHLWRMESLRALPEDGPATFPTLDTMGAAERAWLTDLAAHLGRTKPQLLVVDRSPSHQGLRRPGIDLLRYVRLAPKMNVLLRGYRPVQQIHVAINGEPYDLELWQRQDESSPAP